MAGDPSYDSLSLAAARQVIEVLRASGLRRAYELADEAISKGRLHPALFNARAVWQEAQGRIDEALADFQQAFAYVPNDANLPVSIGMCLLKLGRPRESIAAFDAAIAIKPDFVAAHRCKADALVAAGDVDEAGKVYDEVLAIDPNDAGVLASLAVLAIGRHDTVQAKDFARRSLALYPGNPDAVLTLANVEIIEREFASAERRLRSLLPIRLDAPRRAAVLRLLGDALDGRDMVKDAFAAYAAANAELRRFHAPQFENGRALNAATSLITLFEQTLADRWSSPRMLERWPGEPREHVFLLGFMRSGTTLLELALASHPEVVVMDEHDVLRDANQAFLTSPFGIEQLADLTDDEIAYWRNAYWTSVREYGSVPDDKVFVDKLPFHTVKLPIIAKMFPRAKILFCLRDPRDVVFSSFRRPFEVNATIFETLSLEGGAHFYAAIMRLADIYRSKLPLTLIEHRYERMVEDFRDSLTVVCDFIGISWTEEMRRFVDTAKRANIRNPSAMQVRRPLNSEGVGQWHRYREHIAPIIPTLAPWIAKFGYSPE